MTLLYNACSKMIPSLLVAWGQSAGQMEDLGTLGGNRSEAHAVSSDGSVIVGFAHNAAGKSRAWVWKEATGIQELDGVAVSEESSATAISASGSHIAGYFSVAVGNSHPRHAARWNDQGDLQDLGTGTGAESMGFAISADGGTVVGWIRSSVGETHAMRWTEIGGMHDIGTLPGDNESIACSVSADGTAVAGYSRALPGGQMRAFRWTLTGGMQNLGIVQNGIASMARAMSSDGSAVVGAAWLTSGDQRAFRWTSAIGMEILGTLGGNNSYATDVSSDGAIVVGSATGPLGQRTFRWTSAGGMQDLGACVDAYVGFPGPPSVSLSEDGFGVSSQDGEAVRWTLVGGTDHLGGLGGSYSYSAKISADGSTVIGSSQTASGHLHAFRWSSDEPMGKVAWASMGTPVASGIPVGGVSIRAYWLDTEAHLHVVDPQGSETKTGVGGEFSLPPELFSFPVQPNEERRGVLAEYYYEEPLNDNGSGPLRGPIRNYPDWQPVLSALVTKGLTGPEIYELRSEFRREIALPYPIVFQPGVLGDGELSSMNLRAFVTADPASEPKANQQLPAHAFFSMQSNDIAPSWGYSNLSIEDLANLLLAYPSEIQDNAVRLRNFVTDRVYASLSQSVEYASPSVPIYLVAHSYGGLITRKWLTMNREAGWSAQLGVTQPQLEVPEPPRYVSIEGVHGGSKLASVFGISGFQEQDLNGVSPTPGSAPEPSGQGWNYAHMLYPGSPGRHLYLSNDNDLAILDGIVSPWPSALGVGRTFNSGWLGGPSGFCKRFTGGWLSYFNFSTHSLQQETSVCSAVAAYVAKGLPPSAGGDVLFSSPADPVDAVGYESCELIEASSGEEAIGVYQLVDIATQSGVVSAAAGTGTIVELGPYEPGQFKLAGLLCGAGAQIRVLDSMGIPIEPTALDTVPFPGGVLLSITVEPDVNGGQHCELIAGTHEGASFRGTVVRAGRPALCLSTGGLREKVGANIMIRAALSGGQVPIQDYSGEVSATLVGPEVRSAVLHDDGINGDLVAGDGVYSGQFDPVLLPGGYSIQGYASGSSVGSGSLRRRSTIPVFVVSEDAIVTAYKGMYVVDENGNGLAEKLTIEIQTMVFSPGAYRLSAEVEGPSGTRWPVATSVAVGSLPAAPLLTIDIDSTVLHALGSGKYWLRAIALQDNAGDRSFGSFGDVALGDVSLAGVEGIPSPCATMCVPSEGARAGGNQVLIFGANLDSATEVYFGASKAAFQVLADDVLLATAPAWSGAVIPNGLARAKPWPSGASHVFVNVRVVTDSEEAVLVKGYSYML